MVFHTKTPLPFRLFWSLFHNFDCCSSCLFVACLPLVISLQFGISSCLFRYFGGCFARSFISCFLLNFFGPFNRIFTQQFSFAFFSNMIYLLGSFGRFNQFSAISAPSPLPSSSKSSHMHAPSLCNASTKFAM